MAIIYVTIIHMYANNIQIHSQKILFYMWNINFTIFVA